MRRRPHGLLCASATALLLLTGCSGAQDETPADAPRTAAPSHTRVDGGDASASPTAGAASPSASGKPSKLPEAQPVPTGYRMVTAERNQVSFALPEDFFDFASPRNEDLARSMMTDSPRSYEELMGTMGQNDGYWMARERSAASFANNVQVLRDPMTFPAGRLPTFGDLAASLSRMGASVSSDDYQEVTTSLGGGVSLPYTVEVSGFPMRSQLLLLRTGDTELTYIVISTGSAQEAQQLAETIVSTFRRS